MSYNVVRNSHNCVWKACTRFYHNKGTKTLCKTNQTIKACNCFLPNGKSDAILTLITLAHHPLLHFITLSTFRRLQISLQTKFLCQCQDDIFRKKSYLINKKSVFASMLNALSLFKSPSIIIFYQRPWNDCKWKNNWTWGNRLWEQFPVEFQINVNVTYWNHIIL